MYLRAGGTLTFRVTVHRKATSIIQFFFDFKFVFSNFLISFVQISTSIVGRHYIQMIMEATGSITSRHWIRLQSPPRSTSEASFNNLSARNLKFSSSFSSVAGVCRESPLETLTRIHFCMILSLITDHCELPFVIQRFRSLTVSRTLKIVFLVVYYLVKSELQP